MADVTIARLPARERIYEFTEKTPVGVVFSTVNDDVKLRQFTMPSFEWESLGRPQFIRVIVSVCDENGRLFDE